MAGNKMKTNLNRMSFKNMDAMIWRKNKSWYTIDDENERFVLTPNAPQIARDSFEKYKRINNLNWS